MKHVRNQLSKASKHYNTARFKNSAKTMINCTVGSEWKKDRKKISYTIYRDMNWRHKWEIWKVTYKKENMQAVHTFILFRPIKPGHIIAWGQNAMKN